MVPGKELINKIVTIEWDMFRNVNKPGVRASCQEDRITFEGMRRGQFEAWSAEAAESYLDDLNVALAAGRNLVMEKYIHMMKNISPLQYEKLVHCLAFPGKSGMRLVDTITEKMIDQTRDLFEKYPYVSGSCRPLYSIDDRQNVTSIETYQRGELQTYSNRTLKAYKKHLLALEAAGISFAQRILEGSIKHYGYQTLDEAEAATRSAPKEFDLENQKDLGE
jgi:hypothetical protein